MADRPNVRHPGPGGHQPARPARPQKPYAKDLPPSLPFDHTSLESECPRILEAIDDFKPTILIGVSTMGNLFNQAVVEAMARHNAQPIIFPLSNPTENMECLATEAYTWTKGTVVFAGAVQLPTVHLNGHTTIPSQANNLYIFPAVGLAILATNAKVVTDEMFIEAAHAVADQVPRPDDIEALVRSHLYTPTYGLGASAFSRLQAAFRPGSSGGLAF